MGAALLAFLLGTGAGVAICCAIQVWTLRPRRPVAPREPAEPPRPYGEVLDAARWQRRPRG